MIKKKKNFYIDVPEDANIKHRNPLKKAAP
jgi:hypothetical protein